jgi:lincosamide nucleotidyltransferase A/C/D/E
MKALKVIEIYSLLKDNQIQIWIDGGWGIDALLQRQTRNHSDLDIVIEKRNVEKALNILKSLDFSEIPKDDSRPWNFIWGHKSDHIDFHVIEFDRAGNGIYGLKDQYPNYAFGWTGVILKTIVKCISPKYQIESHSGYELKVKDYSDVSALCGKFGIHKNRQTTARPIIDTQA